MTSPVVDSARAWIGTPYMHQASTKGAGCDCLGLVRGIWRDLIGPEPETMPVYSRDWDEVAKSEVLWRASLRHMRPKDIQAAAPGDVVLFRMRSGCVAKHLGIQSDVTDTPKFIHAYGGYAVTESPLSRPWQRRIVARFAFPLKDI